MNSTDTGIRMKPADTMKRFIASRGSGSVSTISTMATLPSPLVQRLNETNG